MDYPVRGCYTPGMSHEAPVKQTYNPGDIVLISCGEYSYYTVAGAYLVIHPFYAPAALGRFKGQHMKEDASDVVDLLVTNSLVEPVAGDVRTVLLSGVCQELWVGSYGEIDERLLCEHDMPRATVKMSDDLNWTVCPGCDSKMD
jgi:hypothetical protein